MDPALATAIAAILTAGAAVAKSIADGRARSSEASASTGRLGLEERQWVLQTVREDNERLRGENARLRVEVRDLERRFDDLEDRWRETEATNALLQQHVLRCEGQLAEMRRFRG